MAKPSIWLPLYLISLASGSIRMLTRDLGARISFSSLFRMVRDSVWPLMSMAMPLSPPLSVMRLRSKRLRSGAKALLPPRMHKGGHWCLFNKHQ